MELPNGEDVAKGCGFKVLIGCLESGFGFGLESRVPKESYPEPFPINPVGSIVLLYHGHSPKKKALPYKAINCVDSIRLKGFRGVLRAGLGGYGISGGLEGLGGVGG